MRDVLPLPFEEPEDDAQGFSDEAGELDESPRRRHPVTVLVSLGLVAVLVFGSAVAYGVVRSTGTSAGPGHAVEAMYAALLAGDCPGVQAQTTQRFRDEHELPPCENVTAWRDSAESGPRSSIEVVSTQMTDGDSALVSAMIRFLIEETEQQVSYRFEMQKVSGDWLVANLWVSDIGAIGG